MRTLTTLAIAAGLGVLSSTAFAPLSWPLTMVLAVAGLFWLAAQLDSARGRVVVGAGLAYGLGFFGPLIWWMNAVSEGAYVALVLAETAFMAPIMLGLRAAMRVRWWPLLAPAVWIAGEWARGGFPFKGFPWGRLAHTTIDTPFAPYARLLGMTGTSFVMAVLASTLLLAVVAASTMRGKVVAAAAALALTALGALLPTGIAGQAGTKQVALIQGDVPGEFLTWPRGEIFTLHAAETQRLVDRVASGQAPKPDMVLWPENATDTDPNFDTDVRLRIERLSGELDAPILVGGIFDGPTVDTSYNAGVVWTAHGPGDRYIKRRPVPYGEYVPFRNELGGLVPRFDRDIPRDMVAGNLPGGLHIAGTIVGDTICYDIAYDGVVRDVLATDAQVLVVQTSNAAFTRTSQPEQQWDISRLRAIETGRWVLVPSTNGISGVVDADGNVVQRAPMHEPATIEQAVPLASGTTPATHLAPFLTWLLVTPGLGGCLFGITNAWKRSRQVREEKKRT